MRFRPGDHLDLQVAVDEDRGTHGVRCRYRGGDEPQQDGGQKAISHDAALMGVFISLELEYIGIAGHTASGRGGSRGATRWSSPLSQVHSGRACRRTRFLAKLARVSALPL